MKSRKALLAAVVPVAVALACHAAMAWGCPMTEPSGCGCPGAPAGVDCSFAFQDTCFPANDSHVSNGTFCCVTSASQVECDQGQANQNAPCYTQHQCIKDPLLGCAPDLRNPAIFFSTIKVQNNCAGGGGKPTGPSGVQTVLSSIWGD
jgi:hypothetical protein